MGSQKDDLKPGVFFQPIIEKTLSEMGYETLEVAVAQTWQLAEERCESPIESIFIATAACRLEARKLFWGSSQGGDYDYMIDSVAPGTRDPIKSLPSDEDFQWRNGQTEFDMIVPQMEIGEYRVDFLWKRFLREPPDRYRYRLPAVVIECDGHDFHERTKEQAKRDKSRDRTLQREGYHVLHFTGSEIWRNPIACIDQVDEFFSEHGAREYREWRARQ